MASLRKIGFDTTRMKWRFWTCEPRDLSETTLELFQKHIGTWNDKHEDALSWGLRDRTDLALVRNM